ncbi:hypothetical protein FRC10_002624, partial [Ceratobasidium sp. 414]
MAPVTRARRRTGDNTAPSDVLAPLDAPQTQASQQTAVHQDQPLLEMNVHDKCLHILQELDKCEMRFDDLVHSIVYGEQSCQDEPIMIKARKQFLNSKHLPQLLRNIHRPPMAPKGGPRALGAKLTMEAFATELVVDILCQELESFANSYAEKEIDPTDIDTLADITSKSMFVAIEELCPRLTSVLAQLTSRESNSKDQKLFIVMQIAALVYRSNQRYNKVQKVLGFYFRAKQVDKVVVELLQHCGLSVRYSSTNSSIPDIAKKILGEAAALVKYPFVMVHDNIRIPFPVLSQRGDHQSTTDNGTSISVIFLPEDAFTLFHAPPGYKELRTTLRLQRIAGTAPRLSALDFDDDSRKKRLRTRRIHHVIDVIRSLVALSGASTKLFDHEVLQRPAGTHTLPHGKENRTEMTMLKTVNIDETSYGGNDQVVLNAISQLGFSSLESRKELAERIVGWIGDEMTVHRCKGVQQFCQEDPNSFDRLDPFVFIPGLFHLLMAL